jgi:two-component system, OmpR family, KDP operon response regulator KdpE
VTQAMHQIPIVEDEPAIRNVLHVLLGKEGYKLIEAETATRGEIEARSHKPDLLLVDLGLPDADGLSVIRQVRAWSPMPIIVLSARMTEEQKIAALDAGADDYVTKPFSAPELLARVRAGLRRNVRGSEHTHLLQLGALRIDFANRQTRGPQGDIHLTPGAKSASPARSPVPLRFRLALARTAAPWDRPPAPRCTAPRRRAGRGRS